MSDPPPSSAAGVTVPSASGGPGSFPLPAILQHDAARPPTLIAQGAEARLYKTTFLLPGIPCALKYRPPKPYRHPLLDGRLTKHRILGEARNLVRCRREADGGVSTTAVTGGGKSNDSERRRLRQQMPPPRPAFTVPAVYAVDEAAGWLMMEWIEGRPVRVGINAYLAAKKGEKSGGGAGHVDAEKREGNEAASNEDTAARGGQTDDAELAALMRRIGLAVGGLHKLGVVHGDLTTSNMILRPVSDDDEEDQNAAGGANTTITDGQGKAGAEAKLGRLLEGEIVLIDFGLASNSFADEDRAVDLYVLERAFGSTHPRAEVLFPELLEAYKGAYKGANIVVKKLEDVRMRGRKRTMIG